MCHTPANISSPGKKAFQGNLVGRPAPYTGASYLPPPTRKVSLDAKQGINKVEVAYDTAIRGLQFTGTGGHTHDFVGSRTGQTATFTCPSGQVLTFIQGRSGEGVDALQFACGTT